MTNLAVRSRQDEQMDAPDLDPAIYDLVLRDLGLSHPGASSPNTPDRARGREIIDRPIFPAGGMAPDSGRCGDCARSGADCPPPGFPPLR